jgi:hypothetical protein
LSWGVFIVRFSQSIACKVHQAVRGTLISAVWALQHRQLAGGNLGFREGDSEHHVYKEEKGEIMPRLLAGFAKLANGLATTCEAPNRAPGTRWICWL